MTPQVSADENAEADVFLSSAFLNFKDLREEIMRLAPDRFWQVPEELDPKLGVPRFAIVDILVEQIKKSRTFVCVLRDRYGSSVFETESVSFLEVEIYQAALYHPNAHFFLLEPFTPEPRLTGLLSLIRKIRPGLLPDRAQSKATVLDQIKKLVDRKRHWPTSSRRVPITAMVEELSLQRGHPRPDIELFDGTFKQVSSKPDLDHIRELLTGIHDEPRIDRRLTRMWVAIRELSAAPYNRPENKAYWPAWTAALGAWSSAAAWYGLHGHLYAGRLAAVNSNLRIRRMLAAGSSSRAESDIQGSKGARASEFYSISKLLRSSKQQRLYLDLALQDVNDALNSMPQDRSGFLAIRGNVYLRRGDNALAMKDFEDLLSLRERRGDRGGMGEALADLGLAKLTSGAKSEGTRLIRTGRDMLEESGRFTFAIRAQKRLALGLLRTGHILGAASELFAAYESAVQHDMQGQITPLMRRLYHLGKPFKGLLPERRKNGA